MSYTIEYNKLIFYIKNGAEKLFFLFIRQGANNVRDASTNLRAKSWDFVEKGSEKELWKIIGKRMGSVDGGGLQKSKGWEETEYFTPEEYIAQYRSKVKNAKDLSKMLENFTVEAFIYLREEFVNAKDKEVENALRDFIKRYDMKSCGTDYYDKNKKGYRLSIQDYDTLVEFLANMPKGWREDFHSGFNIEKIVQRRRRWY